LSDLENIKKIDIFASDFRSLSTDIALEKRKYVF